MTGSLDYPDLISGLHSTLDDYSEVSPRAQRLGEVARKHLIVHPDSKPPARNSRLGNLKNNGPDLPALSDERVVHLNPFRREVLAKLAVGKRSADLLPIEGVDAENIPDGEVVIGALNDLNLIALADIALDNDAQIGPGAQGLGEAAREEFIIHPHPHPPARDPRL